MHFGLTSSFGMSHKDDDHRRSMSWVHRLSPEDDADESHNFQIVVTTKTCFEVEHLTRKNEHRVPDWTA